MKSKKVDPTHCARRRGAWVCTLHKDHRGSHYDSIHDASWPPEGKPEAKRKKPRKGNPEAKRKKPRKGNPEAKRKKPRKGNPEAKRKKPRKGNPEAKRKPRGVAPQRKGDGPGSRAIRRKGNPEAKRKPRGVAPQRKGDGPGSRAIRQFVVPAPGRELGDLAELRHRFGRVVGRHLVAHVGRGWYFVPWMVRETKLRGGDLVEAAVIAGWKAYADPAVEAVSVHADRILAPVVGGDGAPRRKVMWLRDGGRS